MMGSELFFFQAEDGIRDIGVTGVQTCALPISVELECAAAKVEAPTEAEVQHSLKGLRVLVVDDVEMNRRLLRGYLEREGMARSEERRVGKECRTRWSTHH